MLVNLNGRLRTYVWGCISSYLKSDFSVELNVSSFKLRVILNKNDLTSLYFFPQDFLNLIFRGSYKSWSDSKRRTPFRIFKEFLLLRVRLTSHRRPDWQKSYPYEPTLDNRRAFPVSAILVTVNPPPLNTFVFSRLIKISINHATLNRTNTLGLELKIFSSIIFQLLPKFCFKDIWIRMKRYKIKIFNFTLHQNGKAFEYF